MRNPAFDSAGHCIASFLLLQAAGGVTSLLASFQHSCHDGMPMRLAVHGSVALVWPDQDSGMEFPIAGLTAGQPGVGAHGMPPGNAISQVQLGVIDRVAPASVDAQKIAVAAFHRRVELQWPSVAADTGGVGLAGYWVYRDGLYFTRTGDTQFADETVAPGSTHTYAIYTVDEHYNFSAAASVTVAVPAVPAGVSTPPPGPIVVPPGVKPKAALPPPPTGQVFSGVDPRRVGVRSLGTYWGAAGEQIDTLSGNMNFTVPLIRALSRGGWGVTFALNYNSQMWRRDASGDWLLSPDVGYGVGWKLLAGAITPMWAGSTFAYWLYVDSS